MKTNKEIEEEFDEECVMYLQGARVAEVGLTKHFILSQRNQDIEEIIKMVNVVRGTSETGKAYDKALSDLQAKLTLIKEDK